MASIENLELHRKYQLDYKSRHPERVRLSAKLWRERNPEKAKQVRRESRKRNPETSRTYNAQWTRSHPVHKSAWEAVYRALKNGNLSRPESCERCAIRCDVEAHHPDHRNKLDVRWLCESCHRKEHSGGQG